MKYLLIFLFILVIFVVAVTLGTQNGQVVTFNYLLAKSEYRLSTLLAALFAFGLLLGWSICGLFYLRIRLKLANAERKLRRYQQVNTPTPNDSQ